MASNIVVTGDVNGEFRDVFKKLATLHAKNAFAFGIIVGNLFADPQIMTDEQHSNIEDLINGRIEVAFPTCFALGNTPLPEKIIEKLEASSGDVCEHLYFLGKRTTIKTSEGIRIVALGGVLDPNITVGVSKDKYPPFFGDGDAKALKGAHKADILITSAWPSNVRAGSEVASSEATDPPSQTCIAELCASLKPKYHFSRSPEDFFEREPFFHPKDEDNSDTFAITRFISLAPYNNPQKRKWIYAFSLDPTASDPVALPTGTTSSPFALANKKRPLQSQEQSYRFSSEGRHNKRQNKRHKAAPPTPAECFFCLSNPNVATHLVTSIGDDVYMTTAKGPLSTKSTFPTLGFPCHILIIPLTHTPTLAAIDAEASRAATFSEMQRYQKAMNAMLKDRAKDELGSVTWEVSRSGGIHTHWQYLPIPAELLDRGLVEAAFKVEAQNEKYPAIKAQDVGDGSQYPSDYFKLTIWSPTTPAEQHLVLPIDASFRFNLQFGRKVLAKLLGLEKRFQWQDCGQTEAEETADASAFKNAFKAFDFSLES